MSSITIAFDFSLTGRFSIEKGKNLTAIHAYFVIIWIIDVSLIEFIKQLRNKRTTTEQNQGFMLN